MMVGTVVFALIGLVFVLVMVAVVAVVAALAAGASALAKRAKRDYDAGNTTVPGRSGTVPDSWGGSHDPEARLHRRLVDAMAALRANQSFDDDGALLDLRVALEQQALALDERLVATAALPAHLKADPLAQVTEAVDEVERTVADLATTSAADARPALEAALEDLRMRTTLLSEVQAQLDAVPNADDEADAVPPAPTTQPAVPPQSQTAPPSQTSPPESPPPAPAP